MQTTAEHCLSLTGSLESPPRCETVAKIAAALEGLDFLASLLESNETEGLNRPPPGPPKHAALANEADQGRIQEWLDERRDALNEDLSRILLGEVPTSRTNSHSPPPGLEHFLRRARPLVVELVELARQLEWVA